RTVKVARTVRPSTVADKVVEPSPFGVTVPSGPTVAMRRSSVAKAARSVRSATSLPSSRTSTRNRCDAFGPSRVAELGIRARSDPRAEGVRNTKARAVQGRIMVRDLAGGSRRDSTLQKPGSLEEPGFSADRRAPKSGEELVDRVDTVVDQAERAALGAGQL